MTSIANVLVHADDAPVPTYARDDVTFLGRVGKGVYAMLPDGREVSVRGPLQPYELDNPALPGEVRIEKRVRTERGTEKVTIGAKVVEPGTYERKRQRTPPAPFVPRRLPRDGWVILDERRLKKIGTHNDRDWFTHPENSVKDVELEAQPKLLDLDHGDALPNEPISNVEIDERRYYRLYHSYPRGTLAQLRAAPAPSDSKPSQPHKVIDLLVRFELFTKPGVYWIRGAKAIREQLRRKGIEARLSADRSKAVFTGAGGNAFWSHLDAAQAAEPLVRDDLREETSYCEVTKNDPPVEAVTVAAGGLRWCGRCQP